ncbi:MAG: MgtC/SapB family protein [Eubacteriales bacterium]|nr:MgtC/SapB family protein [Eubacteriales bacterium]
MDLAILMENALLFCRILGAAVCGILIGYERRSQNKVAGIRTHAILAVGAALMVVISKYGFGDAGSYDGSRIAAQIVSGVGFLGTGLIFVKHDNITGLTTSAGIWTTAGIGMAIGAGMFLIGFSTAFLVILLQKIFHRNSFFNKTSWNQGMTLEIKNGEEPIKRIKNILKKYDADVISVNRHFENEEIIKIQLNIVFDDISERQFFLMEMLKKNYVNEIKFL